MKRKTNKLYSETVSTPFQVFNHAIEPYLRNFRLKVSFKSPEGLENFEKFYANISFLIKYMLEDRFKPQMKQSKKQYKYSKDLITFIGLSKGEQEKYPSKSDDAVHLDLLHIVKFFKLLELSVLKKVSQKLDGYMLGEFRDLCLSILHSFSTLILDIEELDERDRIEARTLLFSIIVIYRSFKVKTRPDKSTIVNEYSGESLDLLLNNQFSDYNISKGLDQIDPYISKVNFEPKILMYSGNASSPNSGASSTKLLEDVAAISKDASKWRAILELSEQFKNGHDFTYLLKNIYNNIAIDKSFLSQELEHSRLFHFTAPGGKARIIANVDGVTQTSLSGIHFFLFNLLKTLPSDFTFDHKQGIPHLYKGFGKEEGMNFYSIDLSAATDRIPRVLQSRIIKNLFDRFGYNGDIICRNGLEIVDREYSTKNSPINSGDKVKYAVGQGMGLYTSGPVMALLHHYMTNYLSEIDIDNYSLVGDDNLLRTDHDHYSKYLDILKRIGVEVNMNKTIASEIKKGSDGYHTMMNHRHSIEFARNYVIGGDFIYPIQGGLYFAYNNSRSNIETILFSMKNHINKDILLFGIKNNNKKGKKINYIEILYYLTVNNIMDFKSTHGVMSKFVTLPKQLDESTLRDIYISVELNRNKDQDSDHFNTIYSSLTSTYKSICVVRHEKEVEINKDLSSRLALLCFIDDSIIEDIMNITNRLEKSEQIVYEKDNLDGSPLLSKRERRLLIDICTYFKISTE